MKIVLLSFSLFFSVIGYSQCELIKHISDTTSFDGIEVVYFQSDSLVGIKYGNEEFDRELPVEHWIDCNYLYRPAVWIPIWKNDEYLCFRSGCGTWCYGNLLAPLDSVSEFRYGGDVLMDTLNTIFFTLHRDTIDFKPQLTVEGFESGKTQKIVLDEQFFWGAILYERLDYHKSHSHGFKYENGILTLYLEGKEEDEAVELEYKIEI